MHFLGETKPEDVLRLWGWTLGVRAGPEIIALSPPAATSWAAQSSRLHVCSYGAALLADASLALRYQHTSVHLGQSVACKDFIFPSEGSLGCWNEIIGDP